MLAPSALPIVKVWLEPEHGAETARILLAGHRLPAIGVVNRDRQLIGFVSGGSLSGTNGAAPIGDFCEPAGEGVDYSDSIRDVALKLAESDADFLPVFETGKFAGIVTAKQLLTRLRESYDPMTELPWSDALRHWGAEQLRHQREIAILFIDLDQFGKFNKSYGHVVGDRVLQGVVAHLKSAIDPQRDLLVRYGGDEFAIGTLRDRDEAEELVEALQISGRNLSVQGVPAPVSFSVGLYGGRRSKARTDIHVEANLDNLVNLASRDCVARKSGSVITEPPVPPVEFPFPVVETIQADDEPSSLTYVVLKTPSGHAVGTSLKMGKTVVESVAFATAKAMERAHPDSAVVVQGLKVQRAGSTELITLDVQVTRDEVQRSITAEVEANGDLLPAAASAVISAFYAE